MLYHDLIADRYFFPRPDRPHPMTPVTCSDGVVLHCAHYCPDPKALTLVHFHGNGETVADYQPDYVESLLNLGVNLFMLEYRGYGGSGGRPRLGSLLDDVLDLQKHLGLPPEQVVIYGRSVGSIMAVEWVHQFPRTAGLVLESGIADPGQRLLLRMRPEELGVDLQEFQRQVAARLDHQAKLGDYEGPSLILHAAGDTLVTPDHAENNHRWLGPNSRLVMFPRGDHNTIMGANWGEYLRELGDFLAGVTGRSAR